MSRSGDGEDVKRAIKRLLDGPKFIASMTALVQEKGDGIWPLLSTMVVFEEERLSNNQYPSAEIILYRTTYTGEIVKQGTHTIGIRWTATSFDEPTVTKHVERLVDTTTDVLWNSTLDTQVACGPIIVTEEDYSPLVPQTGVYPFLKGAMVMLDITTWRD